MPSQFAPARVARWRAIRSISESARFSLPGFSGEYVECQLIVHLLVGLANRSPRPDEAGIAGDCISHMLRKPNSRLNCNSANGSFQQYPPTGSSAERVRTAGGSRRSSPGSGDSRRCPDRRRSGNADAARSNCLNCQADREFRRIAAQRHNIESKFLNGRPAS